ncbi:MAG: M14 family zinc carboxypeptidase [Kofleriaceae bacterium]|nr:M14 family zinc carboxypeptidase [Kofleriaceae bacterium]
MKALFTCLVATSLLGCRPSRLRPAPAELQTTAERSQYTRTGRYAETVALCQAFARAYDGVRCDTIGATAEGRPIVALVIARRPRLPVIYVQAGIHSGEIEGKDAGFSFIRDLLDGKVAPDALEHVSVVFVPVLNVDGHERFGPNYRPNQRGPEETGVRSNAQRLNLNRDYVKADAPETQAVLRVIATYDPVMLVDLHTTDGAKFEHDISVSLTPIAPRGDGLDELGNALSSTLGARLTALGHLPVDFYPSFVDDERPHSGFTRGEAPPRFSVSYMAARSRLGILVETHSWRTYKERAVSTYHTLQALFEDATRNAATWRQVVDAADRRDHQLAGTDVTLIWKVSPASREIEFRGYAYERRISDLTGGIWLVYDETKPEIWRVPLYDHLEPDVIVSAPRGGYIVEGGFANQVAALLDRHGIKWRRIEDLSSRELEVFRVTASDLKATYENRTRASLQGAWSRERRTPDAGAIFVPIRQPKARLILHLLEPSLPDSLAQWGLFNATFEHKEYIEPYVMEEAARAMLAQQPGLRAEYEAALTSDPSLVTPEAKLDWFYRRHPTWDERTNLLPVYRIDAEPR